MRLITSNIIETAVYLASISVFVTSHASPLRNTAADGADRPAKNREGKIKSAGGGFQLPLNSSLCQLRGLCDGQTTTFYARNCFCDELCSFYDDCCKDYSPAAIDLLKQIHAVPACQRMANRTNGANSEIWVINQCPPDYLNEYVRGRCEWSPTSWVVADTFLKLPVNGARSRLLYANAYCALCSGETELIFWDAVQQCEPDPSGQRSYLTRTSPIRQFVRSGCPIAFEPAAVSAATTPSGYPQQDHGNASPRKCVSNMDSCDHRWTDRDVMRKCRERTDYVYAGNRVFRNSDCARCNYVNQTYLKCEDTRMIPSGEGDPDYALADTAAYIAIRYDFNRQRAIVSDKTTAAGKDARKSFTICTEMNSDNGSDRLLYDPFADECRTLYCRADEALEEDGCVQRPVSDVRELEGDGGEGLQDSSDDAFVQIEHTQTVTALNDNNREVINSFFKLSTTNNAVGNSGSSFFQELTTTEFEEDDEHSDCDPIQIEKDDYYELADGSGTIHVKSMNYEFKRESYHFDDNLNLFVCSSHFIHRQVVEVIQPVKGLHFNFTMFSYATSYERLSGIFGLILAILCTLISLATFWAFPAFRSSVYGKSFFCFMTSLLFVHVIFLSIQIVDKLASDPLACFCLSAAAQFSSLAYVFWLNIMSIIVCKSLLRSHATVTFAPTTGNTNTSVTGFLFFSLYAWVTPLIIVAVSIALATFKYDGYYDPDKRVTSCWTLGLSQLLLLIVPIGLILVINYVIFSVVFFRICLRGRRRRSPSKGSLITISTVTETEQQLRHQKRQLATKQIKKLEERYTVCFQLTVLTTLTWTFATVFVFMHWPIASHLFIAFQAVLAVTVCLTAVCNPQVWRVISARRHNRKHPAENGAVSHSASGIAKYCTFETDGATIYLKDNGNKIIMRETSI